jgi:hypothetical protein
MGKQIPLVAKQRTLNGGNITTYTKPTVVLVNEDLMQVVPGKTATDLTIVREASRDGDYVIEYLVYQRAQEIEFQRSLATTDLVAKQLGTAGITPAGTVQGGTAATKYFNEATTIGAGATDSITLGNTELINACKCMVNNDASGDPLKVFPPTGGTNNGAALNTAYSQAAGTTKFFVKTADLTWVLADDFTR